MHQTAGAGCRYLFALDNPDTAMARAERRCKAMESDMECTRNADMPIDPFGPERDTAARGRARWYVIQCACRDKDFFPGAAK